MHYFLAKFLPLLVMPLAGALLLAASGWVAVAKNKKTAGLALAGGAWLLLYLCAIPFTARRLADRWEGPPVFPGIDTVQASAVVVLGGFTERLPAYPDRVFFGGGIDRLITGIDLWKKGHAPRLVLSGGVYPGEISEPEAFAMADFARTFAAVPDSVLLIEPRSANTGENAAFTAALFDSLGLKRSIILVTSASHMPRAARLFAREGFVLVEYRTDFMSNSVREQRFPFVLLPSADNLLYVSRIYREMIGYLWQELNT